MNIVLVVINNFYNGQANIVDIVLCPKSLIVTYFVLLMKTNEFL